ncbi:Stp1/IreP family PP2C-type Ser/Thr phosphatase [Cellulomonas sp. NPDC089187]|uniref:Stp1/IreP family PP2C-type Ser/Thr phosphatase n=1 Tax=Cellulomonas sp. NPDC089187 TaxID=3154970 RepID=UPI00343D6F44
MTIALRYAARSDVGLVRSNNQDSAYAGPHLLVVADGMGGHAGGDVASSVAIAALAPLDGESHGPDDALDELERALDGARDEIISLSQEHPELAGMGTTVTAILRSGNKLAMVHLGDSRGYLLRDGVLTQVTSDHTFVQHLVNTGKITAEEAEHHPQRSVVMRVLGDFDSDIAPDLSVREARAGDRWLLCSDGLSGFVSGDTIARTLHEIEDVDTCAERLVQLALRAGGGDNVTVVVADVLELDELPDGAGPTTNAVVVGSAATTRNTPTAASDGPAARAAELSRQANTPAAGVPVVEDEDTDDEHEAQERRLRRRRRVRAWVLSLLAVIVLVVAGFGFYRWTQTQYYVGESEGHVAIYQGIPQSIGPLTFSDVVEVSDLALDDLPPYVQQRVEQTIHTGSIAQARERVLALAEDAEPEPTPTPTPSPSISRSATDSTDGTSTGGA